MTTNHVVSKKTYYAIFGVLIALTLITVQAAYLDLGPFNVTVALGIACIKATLVLLYFMHLRYSIRLTWLIVASAIAWLVVLIVITMTDYMSRGWLAIPGR
jgi:cytochrome c oxidase subunit 4